MCLRAHNPCRIMAEEGQVTEGLRVTWNRAVSPETARVRVGHDTGLDQCIEPLRVGARGTRASLPRRSAIGSQPLLMSTFRAGAFHGSQDGDISALWRTAPGALCEAAQAVRRLSTNAPSTLMGVLLGSGGGEFRRRVRC
jgi:hypothetical protein